MAVNQHREQMIVDHFSLLPNEVLVKIISFLPETRDRAKLRYVSQKLRKISETPSLWREFVWPDCVRCEKERLHSVLKACGAHIKRLSFSQHLIQPRVLPIINQNTLKLMKMSEMASLLQYCSNLTHLSLSAVDHSVSSRVGEIVEEQLREAIQTMKYLEVLNIHCYGSYQPYLTLNAGLKELTVYVLIRSKEDIEASQNWMRNGFNPPNLNIVVLYGSIYSTLIRFREFLLPVWARWNSQMPINHTACLKLYINHKAPLNLFQNAPVFQLRYGATASPPYVQAASVGITDKGLLLTDHDGGNEVVHKARYYMNPSHAMYSMIRDDEQKNQLQLDNNVTNLTELDLSECNLDFKQITFVCPHLQRLNLQKNSSLQLEELQVIATHCCNLRGLNLMEISIQDINFCLKVWEILSSIKLTYLSIDSSFVGSSSRIDDVHKKNLAVLFGRCITLQALELSSCFSSRLHKIKTDNELLSYFPSLKYCQLNDQQSTCVQDMLTNCKDLRYFCCNSLLKLSLSSVCSNSLQQLCIVSQGTDLDDNFMHTVSAHGGLVHVAFLIGSATSKGITTLIKNSPNLLTFGLRERKRSEARDSRPSGIRKSLNFFFTKRERVVHEEHNLKSLGATLQKKFADRKLFTSGLFALMRPEKLDDEHVDFDEWLQNTDLLLLWPPEEFFDLHIREVVYV